MNSIDGIVWQADPSTLRFSFVSAQAERILGYPVARWIEEPTFWKDHLLEEDRAKTVSYCAAATARLEPRELEYRMIAEGGRTVWLHDIVSVLVENGRAVLLRGVMVDITALKRAEQDRDRLFSLERAARAEAEASLRTRDEFLSIASHELRTPCTSLLLGLQSLLRRARAHELHRVDPEVVERMLATADRQVRQLSSLIDRLFDAPRVHAGTLLIEPEEQELVVLVEEVVASFQAQFRSAGSSLSLHADRPVTGRWDGSGLQQVVVSLLSNALKYGAGKPVTVSIESGERAAMLVVRDQGIGIEPALQGRIFERFERASSATHYGGFGLGLYIARAIVEAHGGSISVQSAIGAGSAFRVALPRSGAREQRPPDANDDRADRAQKAGLDERRAR